MHELNYLVRINIETKRDRPQIIAEQITSEKNK